MLTLKNGIVASAFSILNQLVRRLVGIVSLIILARILTPEDFGLVAIALIFLNFVDVITNFGGRSYLLSRETIDDQMVLTNWSLRFILKNAVGVILAVSSFFIADYYDDQRLLLIIQVFALQIFLGTLVSPGLIYKRKKQELGAITQWDIITKLISTGITIYIAIVYQTYWALVIGQFISVVGGVVSSYIIAPMMPRFTLKAVKAQWDFAKWVLPQSILNFFRSQIDALFVSTAFDKAIMGAYNSMRYYASIPSTIFINPIIGTTLTQFSEFKNNLPYFRNQLQVTFFAFSAIAAPIIDIMRVKDEAIVLIVLGQKWVEYADLFGIFGVFIIVTTINSIVSQIVMLKDATKVLLFYSLSSIIFQVLLFTFIEFEDVYHLAKLKIAVDVFLAVGFYIYVVTKILGAKALQDITLPMMLSAVSVVVASQVMPFLPGIDHLFLGLMVYCSAFMAIYAAIQLTVVFVLKDRVYCFNYLWRLIDSLKAKLYHSLRKAS